MTSVPHRHKILSSIKILGMLMILGMISCGLIRDIFYPFGTVDWYPNLEEAMKAEDDRPILLFFHSEFECPYCQKAIEKILPHPEFVEKSKHFRCVHYNIENAQDQVKRFKITSHPAFLILDKKGNVLEKVIGYDLHQTLVLLARHSWKETTDYLTAP